MSKKKPKPATAGEKIEMRRCGLTLDELRRCGNSIDAANVDRAIARAVRKERESMQDQYDYALSTERARCFNIVNRPDVPFDVRRAIKSGDTWSVYSGNDKEWLRGVRR